MKIYLLKTVENIVAKVQSALDEHFLLLPLCFQTSSAGGKGYQITQVLRVMSTIPTVNKGTCFTLTRLTQILFRFILPCDCILISTLLKYKKF